MLRFLTLLLPLLAVGGPELEGPFPPGRPFPPAQRSYPAQRAAIAALRRAAEPASAAATKELLAALDAGDFRRRLQRCCKGVAGSTAHELLGLLRGHLESAELVHNFENGHSVLSLEVLLGAATGYLPTSWQMIYLGWYGNETARYGHPHSPADAGEEGIYLLPPFSAPHDLPGTWEEASERTQYVALNLLRVDMGNPLFGNVSLVFSPSFWEEDEIAACPVDTGIYTFICNETYMRTPGAFTPGKYKPGVDCRNDPTPGVKGAMDHALLNNVRFWPGLLERLFERWYGEGEEFTNVSLGEISSYLETNIFANIPLDRSGIKLMVGAFAPLFGTAKGKLLQRLAAQRGIALAWAFGDGMFSNPQQSSEPMPPPFQPRARVLDPTVPLLNVSAGRLGAFRQLWREAAAARDAGGQLPGALGLWQRLEDEAAPLRVAMPEPGACGDWKRCVGRLLAGDCACYPAAAVAFV